MKNKPHNLYVVGGGADYQKTANSTIETLSYGGGGGIYDGMEARVAKLESDVGYIKENISDIKKDVAEMKRDARSDFRQLFGAIIVVAIGLAGLMAKGFHWI